MSLLFPDTGRITTWNPGIEGGIPSRTVIYATANAATYGNGVTDATAYLQGLFDACPSGQVVYLPAGRYKISSRLVVTKSIVIRGAGPNSVTQIRGVGMPAWVECIRFAPYVFPSFGNLVNVAADVAKESKTIVLASSA